jgi:hypothetical protein
MTTNMNIIMEAIRAVGRAIKAAWDKLTGGPRPKSPY